MEPLLASGRRRIRGKKDGGKWEKKYTGKIDKTLNVSSGVFDGGSVKGRRRETTEGRPDRLRNNGHVFTVYGRHSRRGR